ncbi:MAG: hypothetical protein RLZZ282_326, partial [Verrucomicrobiota bacterium]
MTIHHHRATGLQNLAMMFAGSMAALVALVPS